MKWLTAALLTAFSVSGQTPDLYPRVRALVLEAERTAANMRLLKDHSNPHTWAGDILAHAGYLEDAEQAYAKSPGPSSDPPYILWRAWVVYGQRDRAEKLIESATAAEKKAPYLAAFADLLWRIGQPEEARAKYEAARALAVKIVDAGKRKQLLTAINQGIEFVSDPPPNLVSATPRPSPRLRGQDSPIPGFPITTDGFQDLSPEEKAARAQGDERIMKELYNRAAGGDLAGVERITQSAATPFQQALAIASLEHVFIQQSQPGLAEQFAKRIPEVDSPSSLAKAEALSAAAAAWARAADDERARADFDLAKSIVFSVSDLPFGRISVLVSIATQLKGRMVEEGNTTFRSAIELAKKLPLRPHFVPGVRRPPTPIGVHYQDEAFSKIVRAAIHVRAVEIVNETVEVWSKSDDSVGRTVVDAWIAEGRTEEAIAAARAVKDPEARVSEMLSLAGTLLNEAGGPIF